MATYSTRSVSGGLRYLICFLVLLSVPACSTDRLLETKTEIVDNKIRLIESNEDFSIKTSGVDKTYLTHIADEYLRDSRGPLHFVVSYRGDNSSFTAMNAKRKANYIGTELERLGVKQVSGGILRVDGAESRTVFNYDSYHAAAPEGCKDNFEIYNWGPDAYKDYELGCQTSSYLAKQVARPADLLGKDQMEHRGARPASNYLQVYESGAPNGDISGQSLGE